MQWPGNKADILRAVGHVLDQQGATRVRVEENDKALTLCFVAGLRAAETDYSTWELQTLVEQARSRRGRESATPGWGYEQKLRVVGEQLDRRSGRSIRIEERGGSFVATFLSREAGRVRLTLTPIMLRDFVDVGRRRRAGSDERRRKVTF